MRPRDEQIKNLPKTNIKSKLKFKGIYDDELQKVVIQLAEFLDKNMDDLYYISFIETGKKNIKIKIDDEEKFVFRIINCVFDGTKVDEKYGNTRIEFSSTELSRKPRCKVVGKFNLLETNKINESVLKAILKSLEEIYEE